MKLYEFIKKFDTYFFLINYIVVTVLFMRFFKSIINGIDTIMVFLNNLIEAIL